MADACQRACQSRHHHRSLALIQAITFDFWNTLFVARFHGSSELRRRRIKRLLEQAGHPGISAAQIEEAVTHTWQEWNRVWEREQRTFGAEHWVSFLLDELDLRLAQPNHEALIQAMELSGMEAEPPLIDGLATLLPRRGRRGQLGVICDTGLSPGAMLRQWMASHGVLGYFNHLTFSDELGVSKPHPDAFLTTLTGLGVPPAAAVHIGDYPRTDIAGAQAVGMRAIRFAGVYDWGDDTVQADAVIGSYRELEPLLERWGS
jgi:FMN phosphatase YigB (HAD superfamily)